MIRVLADANVLISAALAPDARSPNKLIMGAALDEEIELLVSPVLSEIRSVLSRPRLRKYLTVEETEDFVATLVSTTTLVADPAPPHPAVCRDPTDDYLVALARAAVVDHLVSGDDDLLALELDDVSVLTPRQLVDKLGADP